MKYMVSFASALVLVSSASGHRSDAGLDMNSLVTIEGTVTEFNW